MHVHFRQGMNLDDLVRAHAPYFDYVLAMPNTDPPIETAAQACDYKAAIMCAAEYTVRPGAFDALVALYLTDDTTPRMIEEAHECGVVAAKLYPKGATTNSLRGVQFPWSKHMRPVYDAMQRCGMILCGHFEDPDGEILTREITAISLADRIVDVFPRLKVVFEHVTTAEAVRWVRKQRQGVAATITAHHLICTLDDVLGRQGLSDDFLPGGGPMLATEPASPRIRPHNYCLPVPKQRVDRGALLKAACSGHEKFFFGSDSALHLESNKICDEGCAGCFVPGKVALALLAWVFESQGGADWVSALSRFASLHGRIFYGLNLSGRTLKLVRNPWQVPNRMCGFGSRPFAAGCVLPWYPRSTCEQTDDENDGSMMG